MKPHLCAPIPRRMVKQFKCEGKQKFLTFEQAERVAKRSRRGRNAMRQAPYHCIGCGQFHIGTSKDKRRRG